MKGSIATSAVLHALVLTWALVSLGSPADFEVADVEALPVDIVPVESITQIQQGDKKAPAREKASPVPTKKPTPVENAENVGENDVDLKTPPTPNAKPVDNESAAAPQKTEKAPPTPDPVKEEIEKVEETKPAAEPATEVAALPEPKQEVKPDTKPEPAPAEEQPTENPEAEALPDKVPTPQVKPKVEKPAQTAKTPERKKDEVQKEQKKASSQKESDFNADEIAALLNKQEFFGRWRQALDRGSGSRWQEDDDGKHPFAKRNGCTSRPDPKQLVDHPRHGRRGGCPHQGEDAARPERGADRRSGGGGQRRFGFGAAGAHGWCASRHPEIGPLQGTAG